MNETILNIIGKIDQTTSKKKCFLYLEQVQFELRSYYIAMQAVHNNRVGFVQFIPTISEAARTDLISHRPLSLLIDDQEWDITANRYRKLTEDQAFEVIAALHAKKLKIRWNDAPRIFYQLKSIAFPRLQQLYLNGNNIESIQLLITVPLSSLKILNLKENNISQIRSLRKCHMPSLEQLTFYKNKVTDFMPIFELHAPSLSIIWTTPQNETFDSADLSWVFRIQSKKMNKLFVKHERSQPFNLDPWKEMVKHTFPKAKHIYRIQDDIEVRRE